MSVAQKVNLLEVSEKIIALAGDGYIEIVDSGLFIPIYIYQKQNLQVNSLSIVNNYLYFTDTNITNGLVELNLYKLDSDYLVVEKVKTIRSQIGNDYLRVFAYPVNTHTFNLLTYSNVEGNVEAQIDCVFDYITDGESLCTVCPEDKPFSIDSKTCSSC